MPQKQKISAEEKVKLVLECLDNKISVQEAPRRGSVDFETVKTWISVYENEGAEGFVHRGQKVYPMETKTAAVIDYLHGEGSLQGICKKYGIRDKRILQNWIEVHKVYLSAILDLYDRRIVAYVVGDRNDNPLVFKTFDRAVKVNPDAHPLFHSDRGFQYTDRTFHCKLDKSGMLQSMPRVAKCIDNGPMEG